MPKFCAVIGCKNTYKSSHVSLHEFPKAPDIRKKWEDFVKVHRADFSVSGMCSSTPQTPTEMPNFTSPRPSRGKTHGKSTSHAVICGDHFLREDYENILAYEMKFDSKRVLKRGAVPSVQPTQETLDNIRAGSKSPKQTVSAARGKFVVSLLRFCVQ